MAPVLRLGTWCTPPVPRREESGAVRRAGGRHQTGMRRRPSTQQAARAQQGPPARSKAWSRRVDLHSRRTGNQAAVVAGWPAAAGPSARGRTRLAALLPRPRHPRAPGPRPRPAPQQRPARERRVGRCRAQAGRRPASPRVGCVEQRSVCTRTDAHVHARPSIRVSLPRQAGHDAEAAELPTRGADHLIS